MKKKYVAIIVLVVLAVAAVITVKTVQKKQPAKQQEQVVADSTSEHEATATPMAQIKTIASDKVPQVFPSNVPWEKNAKILQNLELNDPATGKTQATRSFVSAKTLDDNYELYQKYLKDNGWTVSSSIDQSVVKNLDATKGEARFDITIGKDGSGETTVIVMYVE